MRNAHVINETMNQVVTHRGNNAAKMKYALQMQKLMRENGLDFATMADSWSILASWEGKRLIVDDVVWTPPLLPADDSQ